MGSWSNIVLSVSEPCWRQWSYPRPLGDASTVSVNAVVTHWSNQIRIHTGLKSQQSETRKHLWSILSLSLHFLTSLLLCEKVLYLLLDMPGNE